MDDIGLLTYENSKDLFWKLRQDYIILEKEECSYNYKNFIFTANHLKEWITKDKKVSDDFKRRARKLLYKSNYAIFNNLANRGKHYITDNPQIIYTQDDVTPGFNWADWDWSKFNWEPRKYLVK